MIDVPDLYIDVKEFKVIVSIPYLVKNTLLYIAVLLEPRIMHLSHTWADDIIPIQVKNNFEQKRIVSIFEQACQSNITFFSARKQAKRKF